MSDLDQLRRLYAISAGAPDAFEHRARGYRALYRASGGNDVFPLIAAFGALWARGFLRHAMRSGGVLAAADLDRGARSARWRRLNAFADAFRDLHQRVFAETATLHRLATDPSLAAVARRSLPAAMLAGLRQANEAARAGADTSEAERRTLFDALFRWEQERVVGSRVLDAFDAVQWPLVAAVARRPLVRFSYFPALATLRFADFTSMDERIAQGARAYAIAAARGWPAVAATLDAALARSDWVPSPVRATTCPLSPWLGADLARAA